MFGLRLTPRTISVPRTGSIDYMGAGLKGADGAKDIVAAILNRRNNDISQLILSHNSLADDGCILLFEFLASDTGRKYRIQKISLNSNGIGDRGLASIVTFLKGDTSLKELFVQNNEFASTDPSLAKSFAEATNLSCLEVLTLSTNRHLGDQFITDYAPFLDSPSLRELHCSAMGITHRSVPILVEYFSSPRCRLETLKLNGNSLGFRGVRSVIRAIGRHNYTLTSVEMWSNNGPGSEVDNNVTQVEDDDFPTHGTWQENNVALIPIMLRNDHLAKATRKEALELLRLARTLLLPSHRIDPLLAVFPFMQLPTELQIHVFTFLSPTLSSSQRNRICAYASSFATLPHRYELSGNLSTSSSHANAASTTAKGKSKLLHSLGCYFYEREAS
ncbi:RNI-like protein [Pleurotus eryngii]|uniref:RNI-like protein n=1 Tax=Pleurotus eryngii TaxID=5323 RepID=A0A9P5ZWX1_PLEER|nr:RNI-like protein [Pleurotus eryngii]